MAAPPIPFIPPRTPPVFRVQKTPWREWLLSGGAMQIAVRTPPAQLATVATEVSGQVYVDASVPQFPATVNIELIQRGGVKGTRIAPVDRITGTYTATFPASTMSAGNAATARVFCSLPTATATSGSFNVT